MTDRTKPIQIHCNDLEEEREEDTAPRPGSERGQSLVLIVFMLIGLLAFVGIAVDVGFLFARQSQFSAAVDSATLAGVIELHQTGVDGSIDRAEQFLNANGWPITQTTTITGSQSLTNLGIPQFSLTVTWPVETFFLGVVGFGDVPVTHSATAAFYAQTEMPTATHADRGIMRQASQFLFGPDACTLQGDPVTPLLADNGVPNPTYSTTQGEYLYRIRVPEDYITDTGQTIVRVQLFDPDPHNTNVTDSTLVSFSDGSTPQTMSCTSNGPGDSCIISTGESNNRNPIWLVRVDESWSSTTCPSPTPLDPNGNTVTQFKLYYRTDNGQNVDIASYTSNNAAVTATDMKWVTPGVDAGVPTDSGTFDVDLSTIPLHPSGDYVIEMEVKSLDGAGYTSKNVWDIWAGPPAVADNLAGDYDGNGVVDVNDRNLATIANYATSGTWGVEVMAVGRLPVSQYRSSSLRLPVAAIDATQGGGKIYASVFDLDNSASDPLNFTIDTLSSGDFYVPTSAVCEGGTDCNNKWVNPQIEIGIPTNQGPNPVAFFGGYLMVDYIQGTDEHTWSVAITSGRPFLTK